MMTVPHPDLPTVLAAGVAAIDGLLRERDDLRRDLSRSRNETQEAWCKIASLEAEVARLAALPASERVERDLERRADERLAAALEAVAGE